MPSVTFTDQMNRQVSIAFPPKRIISLVPSQTELLYDLGLEEEIVGITEFCIHPAERFTSTTKIGGTKKLNIDLIRSLQPDLIIGNKEENDQEQMEQLMNEFPVWMSDINNLDDALDMIGHVGNITGMKDKAEEMVTRISHEFARLSVENSGNPKRIAYFIWKDPYMVAGHQTFINDILERAGWVNAVGTSRYPELDVQELKDADPDWIFLSSEPYPFKEKHIAEFKRICPDANVGIVDGEMFSWYGSRLLLASTYLQTLSATQG